MSAFRELSFASILEFIIASIPETILVSILEAIAVSMWEIIVASFLIFLDVSILENSYSHHCWTHCFQSLQNTSWHIRSRRETSYVIYLYISVYIYIYIYTCKFIHSCMLIYFHILENSTIRSWTWLGLPLANIPLAVKLILWTLPLQIPSPPGGALVGVLPESPHRTARALSRISHMFWSARLPYSMTNTNNWMHK